MRNQQQHRSSMANQGRCALARRPQLMLLSGLSVVVLLGLRLSGAAIDGLILYQDFDHGRLTPCGSGWVSELPVREDSLVSGRFGQAYRLERGRTNFLTPDQASVEEGTEGILPGDKVTLTSVVADTRFGRRVLQAEVPQPGLAWTLKPVPVKVASFNRPGKVFLFSAYLRAAQPGVAVRLTLRDEVEPGGWREKIAAANKETLAKDPKAKIKEPLETVITPGEATLGSEWRRVVALLEVDVRRPEQSLVGALEVLGGAPGTVLADGMQLEQTGIYPLSNTEPTSWLPGKTTRYPAWLELAVDDTGFDGRQGTFGCWVRPLPNLCGGKSEVMAVAMIGTGWFTPLWQIGGGSWYVGDAPKSKFTKGRIAGATAEKGLFQAGAHDGWHLLTLAWDENEAVGYLDGKPFGKTLLDPGTPAPGAVIRLGGSLLEHTPMSGDLDEVFLYNRRLPEAEIAALAERAGPLAAELPSVLVRRPLRTTFLRSEAAADLCLTPVAYGTKTGRVRLNAAIPDLQAAVARRVAPGKAVTLRLKPWLAAPGAYPFSVQLGAKDETMTARGMIDIFEEPPSPEFLIYAWGDDKDMAAWGMNCGMAGNRGGQRDLLQRGLWATTRIDVREGEPHPWSPETRLRAKPVAEAVARTAMASPNVVQCLVNSEVGDPPFPAGDNKWFMEWMKKETGLDRIPPEVVRSPIHVTPVKDALPPAILPEDYPPLTFMRWWRERGQGYWLLNNEMVRTMRETGLQARYYSDQPEAVTQFAGMDMVDYWGYPKTPYGLVARIAHSSCMARLVGKPLQIMPGTVFWDDGNGLWLTAEDGKRKVLCLSPDLLTENLWLAVAAPTVGVGLYGLGERRTEIYDPACDAAMTAAYGLIRPVGTLVGGLPAEPARVALLQTDGLLFTQPGVYDNWVVHWITRTASRCLAKERVNFDWITDDHVAAGWLNRYEAVVLPGTWCLPEKTHRALVAFAKRGGKVIADKVLRAEIPGMVRLGIETQAYPDETVEKELGAWARGFRNAHPLWAHVTPAETVHTYVREAGAARYLFIINDRRESGPLFEKWKVMLNGVGKTANEPLRDRGLPQEVGVTVPDGYAVYDVLNHRRVDLDARDGRQAFAVHLEPGGAAVLACFPRAAGSLRLDLPQTMKPGTAEAVEISLLDGAGRVLPGRQLAEITVTTPSSQRWSGVQVYRRMPDGRVEVPLRLPLTAEKGRWQITVREWCTGLSATREVDVR